MQTGATFTPTAELRARVERKSHGAAAFSRGRRPSDVCCSELTFSQKVTFGAWEYTGTERRAASVTHGARDAVPIGGPADDLR